MFHKVLKFFTKKLLKSMTQEGETLLAPPLSVRGMKVLDRDAFRKKVTFPAIAVPVQSIKQCKKMLRRKLPSLQMKYIVDCPNKTSMHKLILLNPGVKFDATEWKNLEDLGIKTNLTYHEMELRYEHFKPREVIKAILPMSDGNLDDSATPKGFSQIGHIVHLNLRDHQLPFKNIIGQVFIDKVNTARTVVCKVNNISNEFRNFEMEVLAGEEDFVTRVVEHNIIFEFDFSKVFWNSRLSTEHNRITDVIPSTDTVFDVFAGVGPFAIPLAKKGCRVFANDLNPHSYHWLQRNTKLNKVKTLETFNVDGRDFITNNLREYLLKFDKTRQFGVHILMNLPAIAVEFLDAFQGLLKEDTFVPKITVHLYMFASSSTAEEEIRPRICQHLGYVMPEESSKIRFVRNVAPNKDMFCISFILPKEVFIVEDKALVEPHIKRPKLSCT